MINSDEVWKDHIHAGKIMIHPADGPVKKSTPPEGSRGWLKTRKIMACLPGSLPSINWCHGVLFFHTTIVMFVGKKIASNYT